MKKEITYYFWSNAGKVVKKAIMDNYTDSNSAYLFANSLMKRDPQYNGKSQVFVRTIAPLS